MADSYTEYLATNVLNNGLTVNYRSLSRALKVHSNLAKQMLYQFHHTQNKKKPGCLHATYLLSGRQRIHASSIQQNGVKEEQEDDHMQSSPLLASSAPGTQENGQGEDSYIRLVTLVKEEQLEDARKTFDELSSIHLYSLEPGTINDLEVLAECNRQVAQDFASEDPLEVWKQYGVIQNRNVKRRTARRQPPQAASAATAKVVKPTATTVSAKDSSNTTTKNIPASKNLTKAATNSASASANPSPEPEQKSSVSTTTTGTGKPPQIKREVSSIFKSFAKAKPKQPKQPTEDSATQPTSQESAQDDTMGGLSDEEAEDADMAMLDEGALDAPAATGKTKKEREDELRQMMEADDEPMEDAPPAGTADDETPAVDNDTGEDAAVAKPETANADADTEPAETVTVSNGRRRGRRRVMKKKTIKDEEGYLVTREEAAWESFSEDEPAPKKQKVQAPPPAAAAKGKKSGGAKVGQGNIMSFFKKT